MKVMRKFATSVIILALGGFLTVATSQAVTLDTGDLVVSGTDDCAESAISRVDPDTGAVTTFSDSGPNHLVMDSSGQVLGIRYASIFTVSPETGISTTVTDNSFGRDHDSGSNFKTIATDDSGAIYASRVDAVLSIDPITGYQTTISGHRVDTAHGIDEWVGAGPEFSTIFALHATRSGQLFAASGDQVYSINPANGLRVLISGGGLGSGPELDGVTNIIARSDQVFVSDDYPVEGSGQSGTRVVAIDPVTGSRTIVMDFPPIESDVWPVEYWIDSFDVDGDGSIVYILDHEAGFGDEYGAQLGRYDPSTDTNTIIKDWPGQVCYYAVAIVSEPKPVPTLSQWGLIAFGMLLLTAMAWALRRRQAA